MKYQNWKKVLGCILVGALLTGGLSACGNRKGNTESKNQESKEGSSKQTESRTGTTSVEETNGITYPLEGKVKLTIAMTEEGNISSSYKDLAHTPFGEAWQEATGVELEILTLPNGEAMTAMIAGGDYPDIIWYNNFDTYPGRAERAVKDGVIEPIGKYLDYAPDLKAALEQNDDWYKSAALNDGTIWSAPLIREDDYLCVSAGLMIRQDWLDELNLELPETPEQLYETLKAFKEKKGAEVPFSAGLWWLYDLATVEGVLTSAFGLPNAWWYRDGEDIHLGAYEKEYKGLLEYLHKLYVDGLLDPNFQTVDGNTTDANFMNGRSGVTIASVGAGMGTYLSTMEKEDPKYNISGFGPLVANKGDKALSTRYMYPITNGGAVITTACKNPEAAAMFLNYGYTEEGRKLFNYGIEGVSYTMENGVPTLTELVMNNPDGLSRAQIMAHYMRSSVFGPFVQEKRYFEQYADRPQQQAAITTWSNSDASKHVLPCLSIAEKDSAEFSKLMGDVYTYCSEMFVNYIIGVKSLDTFESEYLATLKSMGIEKAIAMQQEALDTFNAR